MHLRVVFSFVLFTLQIALYSQQSSLLLADSSYSTHSISKHTRYFEDRSNQYTIYDIIREQEKLNFKRSKNLNFGFFKGTIWLKLELRNNSDVADWQLQVRHPPLDSVTFFLIKDEKIIYKATTGADFQFKERPLHHRFFTFPISLKTNENYECYVAARADHSMVRIPTSLQPTHRAITAENTQQLAYGIYFGLLLIISLYCILSSVSTGLRVSFYYGMYVMFILIFFISQTGHLYEYFIPTYSAMYNVSPVVSVLLSLIFIALFSSEIMQLAKASPRWCMIYKYVIGFLVATLVLQFISYRLANIVTVYTSLVIFFLFLASSIMLSLQGNRIAKYLIPGWAFYCAGVLVQILSNLGFLQSNIFTTYILYFATLFEILIFSVVIAIYYRRLLQDSAQAKQNAIVKEMDLENARMRTRQMQLEKEAKERELMIVSIENEQKDAFIESLSSEIEDIQTRRKINALIRIKKMNERDWKKFKKLFENIHPNFFKNIQKEHSSLTINELRHLAFIKMNLQIKEIAELTGVGQQAVKMARNRLKKKMKTKLHLSDTIDSLQK